MVVEVGVTTQVETVWPAQVPPTQLYAVAPGQMAVKVDDVPVPTAGGLSMRVHTGAEINPPLTRRAAMPADADCNA